MAAEIHALRVQRRGLRVQLDDVMDEREAAETSAFEAEENILTEKVLQILVLGVGTDGANGHIREAVGEREIEALEGQRST
jgi:hypothetical protein